DAVGGEVDGVPAILQVVAEVGGDIGVVFDHEDAHSGSCAGATGAVLILAYGLVNARMRGTRYRQTKAQARKPVPGPSIAPITENCDAGQRHLTSVTSWREQVRGPD